MKKRLVSLIATAILTAGVLVGCRGGKYTDGTYTGEAQGTSGTINVFVSLCSTTSTVEILPFSTLTSTLIVPEVP